MTSQNMDLWYEPQLPNIRSYCMSHNFPTYRAIIWAITFRSIIWATTSPNARIASKTVLSEASESLRQELLDHLVDSRLIGPSFQISCNNDPNRLPMRELPHGSWANLYLMYRAYATSRYETPASKSTFFQVVKEWKVCLKFHRKTHHQICLTCSKLRSAILSTDDTPFDLS